MNSITNLSLDALKNDLMCSELLHCEIFIRTINDDTCYRVPCRWRDSVPATRTGTESRSQHAHGKHCKFFFISFTNVTDECYVFLRWKKSIARQEPRAYTEQTKLNSQDDAATASFRDMLCHQRTTNHSMEAPPYSGIMASPQENRRLSPRYHS